MVSSGAIALGRAVLKLPKGALKLEDSQAAAAVGQIALARTWAEALGQHGITAGQVLVTLDDTEERRRYLNARSTIAKLLEWRSVPVINENDTVATNEIRYGDNDRLAARVATMASADLLVLLSDVDGLYDAPPAAQRERQAHRAGAAHHRRDRGDGGRGRLRTVARRHAHQDRGRQDRHHRRHPHGDRLGPCRSSARGDRRRRRATWFLTPGNPVTARKKWIAGSLEPKGTLTIDAGAAAALRRGKSLLPAGVIRVDGAFGRGDAVVIRGPDGAEVGRGLVAYDAEDAAKIMRKSSGDILADPRLRGPRRDGAPRRPGDGRRLTAAVVLTHAVADRVKSHRARDCGALSRGPAARQSNRVVRIAGSPFTCRAQSSNEAHRRSKRY